MSLPVNSFSRLLSPESPAIYDRRPDDFTSYVGYGSYTQVDWRAYNGCPPLPPYRITIYLLCCDGSNNVDPNNGLCCRNLEYRFPFTGYVAGDGYRRSGALKRDFFLPLFADSDQTPVVFDYEEEFPFMRGNTATFETCFGDVVFFGDILDTVQYWLEEAPALTPLPQC